MGSPGAKVEKGTRPIESVVRRGEWLGDGEWHACFAQRSPTSLQQQHPGRPPTTWDVPLTMDPVADDKEHGHGVRFRRHHGADCEHRAPENFAGVFKRA